MVPDDSIPTNRPLHCEGFYLPHIVITDRVFWGMSRTVHYFRSQDRTGLWHFCYTNHHNGLFFSYYPKVRGITLMSLKRYKRHVFIVKDNWNMIWDSDSNEKLRNHRIDRLIERGVRFKIAMLDGDKFGISTRLIYLCIK